MRCRVTVAGRAAIAAIAVCIAAALCAAACAIAATQEKTLQDLQRAFARDTAIVLPGSGVALTSRGYSFGEAFIEGILARPPGTGRLPAVLMIPGYMRSAVDQIPMAVALAKRGYVCLALSQPGFGRSTGKPDFAGPRTVAAMMEGYRRLLAESFVDTARTALYGYSRGAMVASLMVPRLPGLRCAVLGGGVYDLAAAYRELDIEGIRRNIEVEAGSDSTSLRARSSIFEAGRFGCPVMILHGEKDLNSPVEQARRMHEELRRLGKESELVVIEGAGHGLPPRVVLEHTIDFLDRHLGTAGGT